MRQYFSLHIESHLIYVLSSLLLHPSALTLALQIFPVFKLQSILVYCQLDTQLKYLS